MNKNMPATQPTPLTLVRQPYAITVAKHSFNVHEMRIMTRITEALQGDMMYGKTRSEVQQTLFGDKIVRVPTKLFLRNKDSNNYSAVRRALRSLETKTMTITSKDKYGEYETTARLIMKSKYYLNNEMVEIQLDRDILPDYLALASYSRYLVEVSTESSSSYIMRLYQFVSHWKDKTKKTVTIEELRDILEIGEKYARPKDLRKHILEPCIKDLKQRADVWFEIESAIKSGRSIVGYVFNIYHRQDNMHHASAHEQNLRNMLRVNFGFKEQHLSQVQHILARGELHSHIYGKLEDIYAQISGGTVKHVKAYVIKALYNEFGNPASHNDVHTLPPGAEQPTQEHGHTQHGPAEQHERGEPTAVGEHLVKLAQRLAHTRDTASSRS